MNVFALMTALAEFLPSYVYLAGILSGLIGSAIFSAAEVALFSIASSSLLHSAEFKENPSYRLVRTMLEHPRRLLSTILVGNTLVNMVVSLLAANATGQYLSELGLPEAVIYSVEVVVVTFIILILSEITPKLIALRKPMETGRVLSWFLYPVYVVLKPVAVFFARMSQVVEAHVPKPSRKFTTDDIITMAEVGEKQGTLVQDEVEIIENVIEFGDTTVKEIMTSRVDIKAIGTDSTLHEALEIIREHRLSRVPLYKDNLDNIIGIIHSKDLLLLLLTTDGNTVMKWQTLARKALYVPPFKKIADMLRDFQRERSHMAIVVDEYGGTEGLVTLDDILSQIVGDLSDERDSDEPEYLLLKNGDYLFDAKINLDDMGKVLEREMAGEDDEFESLGGLIYHLFERIPQAGEKITYRGIELTVQEVTRNRVTKIRAKILHPVDTSSAEDF
jgi:gliding motility-associated protein GldE